MDRSLNIENVKKAMEQAGLSQTGLAKQLRVSREAVSKWLSGSKFPRPNKLLRLGLALGLSIDDLVTRAADPAEPVIAFRKRGAARTTATHIARAKDMGRLLSALVRYLPFDQFAQPATLKKPVPDYNYIQQVASKIRTEIGVGGGEELTFAHLIRKFNELQAVIIPVMWGKKDRHENALHIYLPESMTTWVYLNLDVEAHDFKFWMAHELSHAYTPELRGNEAEDFADALAAALLLPLDLADSAYQEVARARTEKGRIGKIREIAECFSISMVSVYREINRYAKHHGLPEIVLSDNLYRANTNHNKRFQTISETLFNKNAPDAKQFIHTSAEVFSTPFFDALKAYLAEHRKSSGFVQSILDTPLLDAKGIYAELS